MAWLRLVVGGSWLTVAPASVATGANARSAAKGGAFAGNDGLASGSTEPPSLLGDEAPEAIRRMLRWLEAKGATWKSGLRVRALAAGERGLVTVVPLSPHLQNLVDVPLSLAFSTEACAHNTSSIINKLPEQLRAGFSRSHALLHLCFLEHYVLIGNSSSFSPYFGSLPRTLDHLPLLTTLNLSVLLQGSHLLQEIDKHRQDLQQRYEEISWEVPDFGGVVSLADFMKTYCMVESRTITRHIGNDTFPLMIPLIDLINHRSRSFNIGLSWSGPQRIPMAVKGHTVEANSQLFFRYSEIEEPASKFFKQFGFVDEDLPIGVKVTFPLRRQHPGYPEKRMLFEASRVQHALFMERTLQATEQGDIPPDIKQKIGEFPFHYLWLCSPAHNSFRALHPKRIDELLAFGRFVVFEGSLAALQIQCDMQTKPPSCRKALAAKEEAAAGRFLLEIVAEHLSLYPSSADAADLELAKLTASSPEWPYVRVRRDEQRCLLGLETTLRELYPDVPASTSGASSSSSSLPTGLPVRGRRVAAANVEGEHAPSQAALRSVGAPGNRAVKDLSQNDSVAARREALARMAGAGLASSIATAAVCGLAVRLVSRAKGRHAD